ncbi:SH3 domain-containing protein [Antarctobacter jejuensis]|uniref:SH3 domain-containing protein n=1 Tax=Antarctobacter jejuensis TaxID=1439938 RepID=UPI003FCF3CBE
MLRLLTFLSAMFLATAAAATTLWVDAPRDGYLNLRTGPSVQYHVLGKMPHGSKVKLLNAPGKWVKVRHQSGLVGWAHGGFLSQTQPKLGHDRDYGGHVDKYRDGTRYWVNAPRYGFLNLRAGPSRHDRVIDKLTHGSEVRVIRKHGKWYKLRVDSMTGWAHSGFLTEHRVKAQVQGDPYWVNTPHRGFLNMRAGPSRNYHTVTQIPHAAKVHVLHKQDQWYKLRYDGQTGWANQRFLSANKIHTGGHTGGYQGQPTGHDYWVYAPGYGGLNLRTGPGTTYDVIVTMQQRDKVQELGRQGDWFLLRHSSGATGWAHGDYLVKQDPGFVPAPNKGYKQGGHDKGKDKNKDFGGVPWNNHKTDPPHGKKAQNLAQALMFCATRDGRFFERCLQNQLGYLPQGYARR